MSRVTLSMNIQRPIYEIAKDIKKEWKNPYYGAKPYLEAMEKISFINDIYGIESASSIISYFLSNASMWRGDAAKRIKKELNDILRIK